MQSFGGIHISKSTGQAVPNTTPQSAHHSAQCKDCKWAHHNMGTTPDGWCYMFADYMPRCGKKTPHGESPR